MKLHPLSWIASSLRRQFIIAITTSLTIASIICLILFISLYDKQLAQERSAASAAVNRLLQTSLENAMLKQDLDGLREIVQKLGQQPDISLVMISNPEREIRFSSDPTRLGDKIDWPSGKLPLHPLTQFSVNARGENVLRSINPVHNKPPCTRCHGPIEKHPINGVLFVDYNAAPIRDKARYNSLLFVIAGISIIGLSVLILWWFVYYIILIPIQRLANASQALGQGDLSVRITEMGHNELGQLATLFNEMASNLQNSMRDIKEKEAFLQALIDAVPDGLRVIDQDYQIIKANRAFCQQIGLKQNAVLKQTCYQSSHARTSPCPPTLITCPLHEIAQTGQPVKTITQHRSANDNQLDVEVFAAPMVVESGGKPVNLIVESVRDLNQAIKFSHEQKLAAMGQLASGMAHEIYNPLTSVRLALQSTLRTLKGGESDPSQIIDYLKLVDGEIDKCVEVTQRLLKLAAPGSEKRQPVQIHQAITETLALLGFESRENNIQIELQLDEEDYQVLARENDIRMVVLNLAQNAFHAMPQGGKLTLQTWRHDGEIYITFIDTGCGIPPKYQSRIFDPFFTHRADKKQGIGLGLSISKTLLSYYGGRIEFTSEWGQGSQFTVVLPDNRFAVLSREKEV
ncbi:MAG: ATP-binding protein [Candidatus Parabeggiatoa sp.]|nr:ATP-binding protein [Candidatus Parabeggiatoa sp.]